MAKLVTIVAFLAAIVALSLSWKPWQVSQKLEREMASMRAELGETETTIEEQAKLIDRLLEEQDALRHESIALKKKVSTHRNASKPVPGDSNTQLANAGNGKKEFIRRTLEDPKMKEGFRMWKIERLQRIYGDFFRDHQLTPEQATKFVDLVFDQENRDMEDGTRFLNGDPDVKPQLTKAEMDAEMRALLGDDGFEEYEAYEKTTTERLALLEVREEVNRSSPLKDDQANLLLQIMKEERERTPLTALDPRASGTSRDKFIAIVQGDNAEQFYRAQADLNQRILSRTGTILSPDQYEALESFLNQYLKVQKIGIEMARQAAGRKEGR